MMRFNYTYKITSASGQCYDRWKSQLNIEVTELNYYAKREKVLKGQL